MSIKCMQYAWVNIVFPYVALCNIKYFRILFQLEHKPQLVMEKTLHNDNTYMNYNANKIEIVLYI